MDVTTNADDGGDVNDGGYQPRRALLCAVEDWLPELYKPRGTPPPRRPTPRLGVVLGSCKGGFRLVFFSFIDSFRRI